MGRTTDLTGKTFGLITIDEKAGKIKNNIYWYGTCECGNDVLVSTGNLNSGSVTSCGCKRKNNGTTIKYELTDERFGRLQVVERVGSSDWLCQCDCGNYSVVKTSNLTSGSTKSCGCLRREHASQMGQHQLISIQHGATMNGKPSTEYNAWQGIRKSVHVDEWSDFNKFFNHMGRRPSEQHQIARRDVRQPHGPNNTYWRNLDEERQATIERPPVLDLRAIIRAEIAARQGEEAARRLPGITAA